MKNIDNAVIEDVSKTIAEYTTGPRITGLLSKLTFFDHDSQNNVVKLSTKWKRLNHATIFECIKNKSAKPFFRIIEDILNPIHFRDNPEGWESARKAVNFSLRFYGHEVADSGKVIKTTETKTYSEAVARSKNLIDKLEPFKIHNTVLKFCNPELLEENYYHTIHEASKSTLSRIRELNQSSSDGAKLIEKSFSTKNPSLILQNNMLLSDSDKNDYNALKHLLLTINFSYRNTTAHKAKIFNPKSELDAITALIMISNAHYLLDKCQCVKFID
jgi:uncharacterized protein (TIGR02391 family)